MILPALILWPLLGAVVAPLCGIRNGKIRDFLLRLFTLAECAGAFILLLRAWQGSEAMLVLDGVCGLGLRFRADPFRALYCLIACFMWAMACQFSLQYFAGHGTHLGRYACFTLITLCGVAGVFLSDDLYTAFVFFEIMSIASYPWVAHEETKGAMRAASTYLGVSIACGMVTLMGMFLCWKETGDLSFAALRAHSGETNLALPACLMLVGYCAKAGMFPLHIWLPKAHPVAPAPASALLSGMLTKTGLFGVVAIGMNLMGDNVLFGHIMLALGLITMTLGAVLAVFSVNLKRTLACSSLSQIGYITVGLACAMLLSRHGALAAAGAVGHMINHSLLKLCLFLCAGAIYMNAHTLELNALRGYGKGKILLHAVFLLGALGLMGVPLLNGYTSKTMIHEGLVELAEEIEGFSAYRLCEWIFLFAAGLTTAYMLKLYLCIFWQKNPDAAKQARYDALKNSGMTARSNLVLLLTAVPLLIIGLFPNQALLPLTRRCADFFNRPALANDVAFFSLTNLMGGGISLLIGVLVYFFFVRKILFSEKEGYLDRWPKWLDLEEIFYRPVFCRFLPWLFCGIFSWLDRLPESRLVTKWIPAGIQAVFSFLDRLPDSKLVTIWVPGVAQAVFSFLDRLPESRLFTKILPGILTAVSRIFDEMVDHILLLIREIFLVDRKELHRNRNHSVFTRLADAIVEGLHRLGVLPARYLPRRAEDDMRYGTPISNAISFGLLLGAVGMVVMMLYVLIRMGG